MSIEEFIQIHGKKVSMTRILLWNKMMWLFSTFLSSIRHNKSGEGRVVNCKASKAVEQVALEN